MSRNSRIPLLVRTTVGGLFLLATFAGRSKNCFAGKLDEVREEVREGDEDEQTRTQPTIPTFPTTPGWSSSATSEDDRDHPFRDFVNTTVVFSTSAPWWLPHYALRDDFLNWTDDPTAPYAEGHDGYLVINDPDTLDTRWWAARISTEYGTNFGSLSRIGTRLIFDTSTRFGFDTEWNQWIEATPLGNDSLATGDFNLVYRFAQSERVQFYSGAGVNWLADSARSDFGFNLTYGVEAFPTDPLVLAATIDLGSLGDAVFFHFRSTAGVMVGPGELFTGYDYQRIGNVNLQGLLLGIRFWF